MNLDETWIVEDCEKHQHVENLSLHPFVGDIGDGRLALQVVCAGAVVVAEAYVEIQVSAMVAVTGLKQLEFELDEEAVTVNEEKVEVCLGVVMIAEETLEPLVESNVL